MPLAVRSCLMRLVAWLRVVAWIPRAAAVTGAGTLRWRRMRMAGT
jgi:hypothetical protein